MAVEALEDRVLLAGNVRAGLAALDKGVGALLFDSAASVQITLSALADGQTGGIAQSGSVPSSQGQSSSAVTDRLSGASDLPGDVTSTSNGEFDAFGSPVLYRVPVSPELLELEIIFSWTDVADNSGGSLQILNSAGRVLYNQALTNPPISLTVQLPPNALSGGEAIYIQIKPGPGSSANAATSPLAPPGFTLEVSPIAAATGQTGAGGSGSGTGAASGGSQSPAGTPVGPSGPESAPSAPDHTIQVTSGPAPPEGTQSATAYVALPSGRAVQVGGIFETETLPSPTRTESSAVDPIFADLMPGPPLLMRGRLSASRATDVPTLPSPQTVGPSVAIANRLTPFMPIVLGPIARLAWAPDRWAAQGDLVFAMALQPSQSAARLAVEPPLASLEPELIDLPMLEAPPPVRAVEQVAAVEAARVPVTDSDLTPRDLQSRRSVVLGSLYFSSVLVLGVSAPTLSATLKRWRRPARREFRIPRAN